MANLSGFEKTLCYNITEVLDYLDDLGFTRSGTKITWDNAEATTNCYWYINNNIINFKRTDGQMAFTKSLVDFDMIDIINEGEENEETIVRDVCAIVFMPLLDGGCALYLGMVPHGTTISQINFTCANGDSLLNNGLVVCSPEEDDGYWYYGWNAPHDGVTPDDKLRWCLDNGHNNYEYGDNVTQIPMKLLVDTSMSLTLVRAYLNFGGWSKNFRVQVTGNLIAPGSIFKINGQKYISFSNNTSYRAPVYKLPTESVAMNLATSTQEYSGNKTYAVGDYCIYEGYLYKCIIAITEPEPFNEGHWVITTVHDELIAQGAIYNP